MDKKVKAFEGGMTMRKRNEVSILLKCNFCGTVFKRKRLHMDMTCPKCKESDIEPS